MSIIEIALTKKDDGSKRRKLLEINEREKEANEENKKKLWCDRVKALNGEDSFSYRRGFQRTRFTKSYLLS